MLAGLEGAAAGAGFDRTRMEEILAGLGKRVFLLHNVHENEPVIFQTRWVLSYLRGPMTREQIKRLMASRKSSAVSATAVSQTGISTKPVQVATAPPVIPPGVDVCYLKASGAGQGLEYYPAVLGQLDVHYASARFKEDTMVTMAFAAQVEEGPVPLDWDNAMEIDLDPTDIDNQPLPGAAFAELP